MIARRGGASLERVQRRMREERKTETITVLELKVIIGGISIPCVIFVSVRLWRVGVIV